jgi:hypothetical protein
MYDGYGHIGLTGARKRSLTLSLDTNIYATLRVDNQLIIVQNISLRATPTRAPRASGVCSGFPSKKHGFIFGIGL